MRISALILAGLMATSLSAPALAGGGGGGGGGGSGSGSTAGNRIQAGFTINPDGTIDTGSGDSGHGAPADDGHGAPADDGHGAPAGDHGEVIADDNPRMVSLPTLVVPLVRDNRLTGYGFVTVRFVVASGHDVWDIREHAHFALDALLRASHRTPVSTDDGSTIDRARAETVWRAAIAEQFGEGVVDTISFEVPDIRRIGR